jgi:hypothetical protein
MYSIEDFYSDLGWTRPRRLSFTLPRSEVRRSSSRKIVWYESGERDYYVLQVNTTPRWFAAVFAIRYRIFTGWHKIPQFPVIRFPTSRLELMSELFHVSHFATVTGRRQFRVHHPEAGGFSWTKIRTLGPAILSE